MAYEIDDGYTNVLLNEMKFPVIRRVFPSLIANSLVSIQPMTAPVGAVFYYDGYMGAYYNMQIIENELRESSNIKETLVFLIRKYAGSLIIEVVDKDYPEHRELLDKLLVLK
jgi:hypothetical protein